MMGPISKKLNLPGFRKKETLEDSFQCFDDSSYVSGEGSGGDGREEQQQQQQQQQQQRPAAVVVQEDFTTPAHAKTKKPNMLQRIAASRLNNSSNIYYNNTNKEKGGGGGSKHDVTADSSGADDDGLIMEDPDDVQQQGGRLPARTSRNKKVLLSAPSGDGLEEMSRQASAPHLSSSSSSRRGSGGQRGRLLAAPSGDGLDDMAAFHSSAPCLLGGDEADDDGDEEEEKEEVEHRTPARGLRRPSVLAAPSNEDLGGIMGIANTGSNLDHRGSDTREHSHSTSPARRPQQRRALKQSASFDDSCSVRNDDKNQEDQPNLDPRGGDPRDVSREKANSSLTSPVGRQQRRVLKQSASFDDSGPVRHDDGANQEQQPTTPRRQRRPLGQSHSSSDDLATSSNNDNSTIEPATLPMVRARKVRRKRPEGLSGSGSSSSNNNTTSASRSASNMEKFLSTTNQRCAGKGSGDALTVANLPSASGSGGGRRLRQSTRVSGCESVVGDLVPTTTEKSSSSSSSRNRSLERKAALAASLVSSPLARNTQNSRPATPSRSSNSRPTTPGRSTDTHSSRSTTPSRSSNSRPKTPSRSSKSRPTTPSRSSNLRSTTPSRSSTSRPTTPSRSSNSRPTTPSQSSNSRPTTPSRTSRSRPTSPSRSSTSRPTTPSRSSTTRPTTPTQSSMATTTSRSTNRSISVPVTPTRANGSDDANVEPPTFEVSPTRSPRVASSPRSTNKHLPAATTASQHSPSTTVDRVIVLLGDNSRPQPQHEQQSSEPSVQASSQRNSPVNTRQTYSFRLSPSKPMTKTMIHGVYSPTHDAVACDDDNTNKDAGECGNACKDIVITPDPVITCQGGGVVATPAEKSADHHEVDRLKRDTNNRDRDQLGSSPRQNSDKRLRGKSCTLSKLSQRHQHRKSPTTVASVANFACDPHVAPMKEPRRRSHSCVSVGGGSGGVGEGRRSGGFDPSQSPRRSSRGGPPKKSGSRVPSSNDSVVPFSTGEEKGGEDPTPSLRNSRRSRGPPRTTPKMPSSSDSVVPFNAGEDKGDGEVIPFRTEKERQRSRGDRGTSSHRSPRSSEQRHCSDGSTMTVSTKSTSRQPRSRTPRSDGSVMAAQLSFLPNVNGDNGISVQYADVESVISNSWKK